MSNFQRLPALWIYDNFILQGVLPSYSILRWNRRFNELPTFELHLPFDSSIYELLKKDRIIYRNDLKEAMQIVDRNKFDDVTGSSMIIVRGEGLERILDGRMQAFTAEGNASTLITTLLNQTIISPADIQRQIINFVLGSMATQTYNVKVDLQQRVSVLGTVSQMLQPNRLGFEVEYNLQNQTYVFNLIEKITDKNVIFDRKYKNIISSDIFDKSSNYRNIAYVGDTPVGTSTGIQRREIAVQSIANEDSTVTGNRVLAQNQQILSVDVRIDAFSKQYLYLTDWDLGDIITFRDRDLNIEIKQNILEIREFYEGGRRRLDVVFGDYLPGREGIGAGGTTSRTGIIQPNQG